MSNREIGGAVAPGRAAGTWTWASPSGSNATSTDCARQQLGGDNADQLLPLFDQALDELSTKRDIQL